jgi:2-amino-4-hydroxy-6-hydroxymethyldihydropteridine diphosphokinase
VFLGLGGNLGDPVGQLRRARCELIGRGILLPPVQTSSLYRTPPWGDVPGQPWFFNAVLAGNCALSPGLLLDAVRAVEDELGRRRTASRWGPRRIDIDILLYDRSIITQPTLEIPHPRLRERAFVLVPLLEIAPNLHDPVTKQPYSDFLAELNEEAQAIERVSPRWFDEGT